MARKMLLVPMESFSSAEKLKNSLDRDLILSAIPKSYRIRAGEVLNRIAADPQMRLQWNEHGELIYHGKVIHGSHIIELLKNLQGQKKNSQLLGHQQFQDGLKELNIPMELHIDRPGPPGIRQIQWFEV